MEPLLVSQPENEAVDDRLLVRRSLEDPNQFGLIFERHHRAVWSMLARIGGVQLADDHAGEAFAVAFDRRDSYDPSKGEVRSWLFGIAANLARTRWRRERRAATAQLRLAATEPRPIDFTEVHSEADELRSTLRRLAEAIEDLDERDQELIALAMGDGHSYADVAAALDIPIGTVRSRLSRLRVRLRTVVDRDQPKHVRAVPPPADLSSSFPPPNPNPRTEQS